MNIGAWIFGGFLLFMCLIGLVNAAREGARWVLRKPGADIGGAVFPLVFALVLGPLGYFLIHYRGADWTIGPTGERIGFGVLGGVLLVAGIVFWLLGPRVRGESGDFVSDVLSEGPADALGNAFGQAIGPRASAVVIAALGAFVCTGVMWPENPKAFFAAWLIAVDAIELFGYGLIMLVLVGFAFTGEGFALFFLALFGVGIGIGLALGLLDGWITILRWLGGLIS